MVTSEAVYCFYMPSTCGRKRVLSINLVLVTVPRASRPLFDLTLNILGGRHYYAQLTGQDTGAQKN